MNRHADKAPENKPRTAATTSHQQHSVAQPALQFIDKQANSLAQRQREHTTGNSHKVAQLRALGAMANHIPEGRHAAQLKVIQLGSMGSKMVNSVKATAPTNILPRGTQAFRATMQSPKDLQQAGGMRRLVVRDEIPKYRIAFYMLWSDFNPGVISTARTHKAAVDFGLGLYGRQEPSGKQQPVYIYQMDVGGAKAVDLEHSIPRLFAWIYKGEAEKMIMDDIPLGAIKYLEKVGGREEIERPAEEKKNG